MNVSHIQRIKFTGPLALAIGALPFSIVICHIGLAVFGIIWVLDGKWKEKWEIIFKNYSVVIFFLFFLLHLFGIAYSEDKHTAWFILEKKASLLILPIMLASIKLKKEDVKKLLHVFIVVCIAATIICLWTAIRKADYASPIFNFNSYNNTSFYALNSQTSGIWMFISYIQLASGIGIHPAYLSLYIVFCVFLLIHFYSDSFATFKLVNKILLLTLFIYLSIFILFLSTRIMIFGFLIISIYGLNQFLKSTPRLISWITSTSVVALFLSVIYMNPVSRFRSYQEIITTWPYLKPGLQSQSTTIRASLWSTSIKSLSKINWLLGTGTGDVQHLISETSKRTNITNVLGTYDPHNQYLQTLLGLGLIGLSTLIICFVWPTLACYQTGNILYIGFIFLFSALCLTETAMELQKGIVFYSLFGSLLLFQYHPVQEDKFSPKKA